MTKAIELQSIRYFDEQKLFNHQKRVTHVVQSDIKEFNDHGRRVVSRLKGVSNFISVLMVVNMIVVPLLVIYFPQHFPTPWKVGLMAMGGCIVLGIINGLLNRTIVKREQHRDAVVSLSGLLSSNVLHSLGPADTKAVDARLKSDLINGKEREATRPLHAGNLERVINQYDLEGGMAAKVNAAAIYAQVQDPLSRAKWVGLREELKYAKALLLARRFEDYQALVTEIQRKARSFTNEFAKKCLPIRNALSLPRVEDVNQVRVSDVYEMQSELVDSFALESEKTRKLYQSFKEHYGNLMFLEASQEREGYYQEYVLEILRVYKPITLLVNHTCQIAEAGNASVVEVEKLKVQVEYFMARTDEINVRLKKWNEEHHSTLLNKIKQESTEIEDQSDEFTQLQKKYTEICKAIQDFSSSQEVVNWHKEKEELFKMKVESEAEKDGLELAQEALLERAFALQGQYLALMKTLDEFYEKQWSPFVERLRAGGVTPGREIGRAVIEALAGKGAPIDPPKADTRSYKIVNVEKELLKLDSDIMWMQRVNGFGLRFLMGVLMIIDCYYFGKWTSVGIGGGLIALIAISNRCEGSIRGLEKRKITLKMAEDALYSEVSMRKYEKGDEDKPELRERIVENANGKYVLPVKVPKVTSPVFKEAARRADALGLDINPLTRASLVVENGVERHFTPYRHQSKHFKDYTELSVEATPPPAEAKQESTNLAKKSQSKTVHRSERIKNNKREDHNRPGVPHVSKEEYWEIMQDIPIFEQSHAEDVMSRRELRRAAEEYLEKTKNMTKEEVAAIEQATLARIFSAQTYEERFGEDPAPELQLMERNALLQKPVPRLYPTENRKPAVQAPIVHEIPSLPRFYPRELKV